MENILPYLDLAGQIFEVAGAFLLFFFAYPPSLERLRGNITWADTESSKELQDAEKKWRRRQRLGFLLIFIGFLLQVPIRIPNP